MMMRGARGRSARVRRFWQSSLTTATLLTSPRTCSGFGLLPQQQISTLVTAPESSSGSGLASQRHILSSVALRSPDLSVRMSQSTTTTRLFTSTDGSTDSSPKYNDLFQSTFDDLEDVLPFEESSHRSTKVIVPEEMDPAFDAETFQDRLIATIDACQQLGKTSIWLEVPMNRCSLIEHGNLKELGFQFHHALEHVVVLNRWLQTDVESKVPKYATHNVGVGAVVVNSRNEILLVREKRRNFMKWKTPTGLSDLGEEIGAAAVREVLEETGIRTTFHSVLGFRQTHGLAHGISDLFFVCRLDPVEETDEQGTHVIPEPVPEVSEIETAEWVPLSEYRELINDREKGHPMMRHVLERYDNAKYLEKNVVHSVVPGRKPNAIYLPK